MTMRQVSRGHVSGPSGAARRIWSGAAAVLAVSALSACSAGGAETGVTTAAATSVPPVTGDTGEAPEPTTVSPTVSPAPSPSDADAGGSVAAESPSPRPTGSVPDPSEVVEAEATSTSPRTSAPPTDEIRLAEVSVSQEADSEVVHFETTGGAPGFQVRYVDAVRIEGEPVLVQGDAVLEVVLRSANPEGEEGLSAAVAVDEVPAQDLVQEIRFARYLDGVVTYAIGMSTEAEFTVSADDDGLTITFPG